MCPTLIVYKQLNFRNFLTLRSTLCVKKDQRKSTCAKNACKMIIKLTHGVNLINILQAAFAPIFFCQTVTKPNCNSRKALNCTFMQRRCKLNDNKIDLLSISSIF